MFSYAVGRAWYDVAPPGTEDVPPGTVDYPPSMMEDAQPPGAEDVAPPGLEPTAVEAPPVEVVVAAVDPAFQQPQYNHAGYYPYAYVAPPPPPEEKAPTKPTVLGKLQAKKRLLAFSQTKQLKPPGTKSPPKPPSKAVENAFNKSANSTEDEDKDVKKKKKESKIPTAFRNMAEIKKEEEELKKSLLQGNTFRKGYDRRRSYNNRRSRSRSRSRSRDRYSRSNRRSRSRSRDRRSKRSYSSYSSYTSYTRSDSRSDRRTTETSSYISTSEAPTSDRESTISRISRKTDKSDKSSRNGDARKRSLSSDRSQKSKGKENQTDPLPKEDTPPPKSPATWSDVKAEMASLGSKSKSVDKKSERSARSHEKARSAASSRHSPTRTKSSLFSTPEHKTPFVAIAANRFEEDSGKDQKEKEYPQTIIKFTKVRPNLSYCINPTRAPGYYRSRSEILNSEPPAIVDIMNQFLESAVASVNADSFGLETLVNSYDAEDMSDDESDVKKAHERPWMMQESRMESLSEVKFIPASVDDEDAEPQTKQEAQAKEEDAEVLMEEVEEGVKPKKAKKRKIEDDEEKEAKKKKKKDKKAKKKKKLKKKAKKKNKKEDSDDSSDEEVKEDGAKKKKTKKKAKKKAKSESSSDGSSADSESDAEKPKKRNKKLKKRKSKSKKGSSDSESGEEKSTAPELKLFELDLSSVPLPERPAPPGEDGKNSENLELEGKNDSVNLDSSLGSSFETFFRTKFEEEAKTGKAPEGRNWALEFEEYLRLKFQREKVLKELKKGDKKEDKKKKKKQRQASSDSSSSDSSSESDSKRKRKKKKSKKKRARSSSSSSSVEAGKARKKSKKKPKKSKKSSKRHKSSRSLTK